jgi:predicted pyridoxine 5'-phosphate oxidase superfamily flavin-nucleotide-binding protein
LIFFIPGVDETLRVNGAGVLSADPALLAALEEIGKPPRAVLCDIAEAFLHRARP